MVKKIQTEPQAPWKQRYHAPSITYSKIAAKASERGFLVTNRDGLYQIYSWDTGTGTLERRTNRPEGLISADISPDGRYIYYLDDQTGNEIGHFVRIPYQGGEPEDITPDLPPYNPSFSFIDPLGLALSRAGNRAAFTAALDDGFHIYVIDLDQEGQYSEPREIYHCEPYISGPILSASGDILLISSTERYTSPQYSLLAFDVLTGEKIGELWEGDEFSVSHLLFSPVEGDIRVAGLTNQSGLERLVIWNPRTGERIDPALDEFPGAINCFDWSADGKKILFRTFNAAVQQLYIYDVENDRGYKLNHPSGTNFSPYFTPQGDIHSHLSTATEPTRLVLLDSEKGYLKEDVLQAGKVPSGKSWSSFTFQSSDGQEIQGWLATPDGDGPYPLILDTHGGPQTVMAEYFLPDSQAWLDHGFAWASINYRGSTTFGKEFEEQIWGNLGDLEVEDMVAARKYLVEEGTADAEKIFLTGWSYGGYLTLQALGKYPDLWAGGLAGIAISDWALSYEYSAESLKRYDVAIFGGTPEEKPEAYAKSSPVTYIEDVTAPILIIQGRNDTRTPARPIEIYEEKMKALGKEIEVYWFDAGHLGPFAQVEQAVKHQEMMMQFAYKILN
jgi:dipeptidyl aminopeptidase/acylaminoacyl peptidase